MGIAPASLKGLRVGAMKAFGRAPRGASLDLRLRAHSMAKGAEADPMIINAGQVAFYWALAIWEAMPNRSRLDKTLHAAIEWSKYSRQPWKEATDPAQVYVLTMARAGLPCSHGRGPRTCVLR